VRAAVRLWAHRFTEWLHTVRHRVRFRARQIQRPFWLWLYRVSGRKLYIEDRVTAFDEDWWRLVRHQLRRISDSDLGDAFIRFLFYDDRIVDDHPGREVRPQDREVRLDR
jgi:hypothetical protein